MSDEKMLAEFPARFCRRCGRPMIKTIVIAFYDQETGHPKFSCRYHCPRSRLWNTHGTDECNQL